MLAKRRQLSLKHHDASRLRQQTTYRPQRQCCRMAPTTRSKLEARNEVATEATTTIFTTTTTTTTTTTATKLQSCGRPTRNSLGLGGRRRQQATGSGSGTRLGRQNHGSQVLSFRRRQQVASLRSLLAEHHQVVSRQQQPEPEPESEPEDVPMVLQDNLLITYRDAMDEIKSSSRPHQWFWRRDPEAKDYLVSEDQLEVCFHPEISATAAAIRGSEPFKINGNYYYWELKISEKCYGTSVMFGLCTERQALHCREYCNLIGLDEHGWSLSHKGLAWHGGQYRHYTRTFPTDQIIKIGLLFDTMRGELSYFMDGKNLGVAFKGLQNVNSDLYPVVGSTAKMTKVRITGSYVGYISLLERSCFSLLKSPLSDSELLKYLKDNRTPKQLVDYITSYMKVCRSQTENTANEVQYNCNADVGNWSCR